MFCRRWCPRARCQGCRQGAHSTTACQGGAESPEAHRCGQAPRWRVQCLQRPWFLEAPHPVPLVQHLGGRVLPGQRPNRRDVRGWWSTSACCPPNKLVFGLHALRTRAWRDGRGRRQVAGRHAEAAPLQQPGRHERGEPEPPGLFGVGPVPALQSLALRRVPLLLPSLVLPRVPRAPQRDADFTGRATRCCQSKFSQVAVGRWCFSARCPVGRWCFSAHCPVLDLLARNCLQRVCNHPQAFAPARHRHFVFVCSRMLSQALLRPRRTARPW